MKSFGERKELINSNINVDYIIVDGFKVYTSILDNEWEEKKVSEYYLFNSNSINIYVEFKKYDEVLLWLKKHYTDIQVNFNFDKFAEYVVKDRISPDELCLKKNTNVFLAKAWAYEETLSAIHESYEFYFSGEGYLVFVNETRDRIRMFIDDPKSSRYFDISYYPKSYSLASTMAVLNEYIKNR
jgi:hypothetical protein